MAYVNLGEGISKNAILEKKKMKENIPFFMLRWLYYLIKVRNSTKKGNVLEKTSSFAY